MDRQLYFGRAQVPKSSYIIILVSSHAKPPRSSEAGTKGLREEARGGGAGGPTLTSSGAPRKAWRDTLHFEPLSK